MRSTEKDVYEAQGLDFSRRAFIKNSSQLAIGAAALLSISNIGCAFNSNEKQIRLAVAGGNFGTKFFWHEHPNCKVHAVTDLHEDRREKLKLTYHCDNSYDSLEELIKAERDKLDVVAVFTDGNLHFQHVKLCMENGLHVISAVPAVMTVEEAEALLALKLKTGLKYKMAETSYYDRQGIVSRGLYEQNHVGKIFYSELEYYHDKGDLGKLITNKRTRFWNPDGSPSWRWGFPPMHYPTHATGYLIGTNNDRLKSVSCTGWGTEHPFVSDNQYDNPFWNCASMFQTESGGMSRINTFWLTANPHGNRARFYGSEADFYMPMKGIHGALISKRGMRTPQKLELPKHWKTSKMLPDKMRHKTGHGDSHVFIAAEFINALIDDREPEIDIYKSLNMTVPGILAHQSTLQNGLSMPIPIYR